MSELEQLRQWREASPSTRQLKNGWVDAANELHVFVDGTKLPYLDSAEARGAPGSLVLHLRDGDADYELIAAVEPRGLHVHALDRLWSQRAIVPRFEPQGAVSVRQWLPVTALGLTWLLEAGLDPARCFERDSEGGVHFSQIPGFPLASRTFTVPGGTLEEVGLTGWPAHPPQWRAPWHVEAGSLESSVSIAAMTPSLSGLREAMRAGVRGWELSPDRQGSVWLALVEGSAVSALEADAVTFVEVQPNRRATSTGTRQKRAQKTDSVLVIDADPHAARVWVDRTTLLRDTGPKRVPLPPHLTSRHPFGDWFVHSLATEAPAAAEPAMSAEARLARLSKLAEAVVRDTVCGVDHYLEHQQERSGDLEVAVVQPVGAGKFDRRPSQATAVTLRLTSSGTSSWEAKAGTGVKLELSAAAAAGAGFLLSSSNERPISLAFVVDMRGHETQLACVASTASAERRAPVCVAQELLHVGLLSWAHPWVTPGTTDLIRDVVGCLSIEAARTAALRFYDALLPFVGAFVASVLTSPRAMQVAFQDDDDASHEDLAAWGADTAATVVFEGWGVAPLWQQSEIPDLPVVRPRDLRERVRKAMEAGIKGTPAEGVLLRIQPPEANGPRFLLDAYYAGHHAVVVDGRPGMSYGPLGLSGQLDGHEAVEASAYFEGTYVVGDSALPVERLIWRASPAFALTRARLDGVLEGAARSRLPWAVAAERHLRELAEQLTAEASAQRAARLAVLERFAGVSALAGLMPAIRDWFLRAPSHELTVERLARLGVANAALQRSLLEAMAEATTSKVVQPPGPGEPVRDAKPTAPRERVSPAPPSTFQASAQQLASAAEPSVGYAPAQPALAPRAAPQPPGLPIGTTVSLASLGLPNAVNLKLSGPRSREGLVDLVLINLRPSPKGRGMRATEADLVFYNQLRHRSGAISLKREPSDSSYKAGAQIDLDLIDPKHRVAVGLFVYSERSAGPALKAFKGLSLTLHPSGQSGREGLSVGDKDGAGLAIDCDALLLLEFFNEGGEWRVESRLDALPQGGLASVCQRFGIAVDSPASQPAASPEGPQPTQAARPAGSQPAPAPRPAPPPQPALTELELGDTGRLEGYGITETLSLTLECDNVPDGADFELAAVRLYPTGGTFRAKATTDLVFFGAQRSRDGAVACEAQTVARRGKAAMVIALDRLAPNTRLAVAFFLYSKGPVDHSLGRTGGVKVTLRGKADTRPVLTLPIPTSHFKTADAVELLQLSNEGGAWTLRMTGERLASGGIGSICGHYGVPV